MLRFLKHVRNRLLVESCGPGSRIEGKIDLRSVGSSVVIGSNCLVKGLIVAETPESRVVIGDRSLIGSDTILDCALSITIGSDVLVSYGCLIMDSDNHSVNYTERVNDLSNWMNGNKHDWSCTEREAVTIKSNSWIGARSIILKGVTIGKGAVVGAGSTVTTNVPPFAIVAGNPARIIRYQKLTGVQDDG